MDEAEHGVSAQDPGQWLGTAHALADAARRESMRWFRTPLTMQRKADASPVTQADQDTETLLRALIAQRHPSHGIVGEELGATRTSADLVWVLDPIDGTKSYLCGLPLWGTLIGLVQGEACMLGLIDMPALDERWVALRGGPAWFIGRAASPVVCRTSGCADLRHARVCAAGPDAFDACGRRAFDELAAAAAVVRYGGDCYAYGLLASGHLDLVVDAGLAMHDVLPVLPIIEAAGGVLTDWQGRAVGLHGAGQVLAAASSALHREALNHLAKAGASPS